MRHRTGAATTRTAVLVLALVAALVVAGCGSGSASRTAGPTTTVPADHPVALLAEPDGSLLFAERLSGDVRRMAPDGTIDAEPVAHVDVVGSVSDQRGLLGLTRTADGALYAAWVRPGDERLVVGQLTTPEPVIVWQGPTSADLANGGHLATAPDGRIVIGVGDLLQDRALADDPTVPNRKLLALDPAGPPDQVPTILSSGWNNPFAFTFDDEGRLWVADNSPGDQPERIGRGDRPAADAVDLDSTADGEAAPAALVALPDGRLGRCGFLTGRLDEIEIVDGEPRLTGRVLAEPCRTGGAVLADGRLATATEGEITLFP